jgi:hypothetical protein
MKNLAKSVNEASGLFHSENDVSGSDSNRVIKCGNRPEALEQSNTNTAFGPLWGLLIRTKFRVINTGYTLLSN